MMAGLLDWMQKPEGIGLLSALAGGMAGARRGTPWNNVGRGLVTGVGGYQGAQQQLRADEENAFAKQYKTLKMQELERSMADKKALRDASAGAYQDASKPAQFSVDGQTFPSQAAAQASAESMFSIPSGAVPDSIQQGSSLLSFQSEQRQAPASITDFSMGHTPQVTQQQAPNMRSAMYGRLMEAGFPEEAAKYAPKEPKWTVAERYNEATGMPEKVLMDENNPEDIRPFGGAQADTVVADNLGGTLVYRGSRSATPIGQAQRTASPDSVLSSNTARRGQDISNANAAAARAVTIREQDKPPQAARGGPMSVTLQKELIESDDVVQASQNVISTLDSALAINDKAYSGYGAKPRAVLRSNLPGASEAADATISIDNMMTGQALESLKVIFGGMPTEGERKILMDMQASADKTPEQRADIMVRAKAAAKRRGEYAANKAQSIRSGTYLTEGAAPPPTQTPATAPKAKSAATFDLPPNAKQYEGKTLRDTKSGKRFKSVNGKWQEVR